MSRIAKNPVPISDGVDVKIDGQRVTAKGKLGELQVVVCDDVGVELKDGAVVVTQKGKNRHARNMWGTSRSLVQNIVNGVSNGFEKKLQIQGVGYRANMQGKTLVLQLGYSHDVHYPVPEGIDIKVENNTEVTISGIDKQKVGQIAAEIRAARPPEPYKGKGVRYDGERVIIKEGKKK